MKLAVLDDYQRVALKYADWRSLKGVEVAVFDRPLQDPAQQLAPFDIVCLMRERTAFPKSLIDRLPNLKFISLTGARSPSLDTAACKARGIPVSHTRSAGGGISTVELTWGLIIAGARGLGKGERNMRAGRWHEGIGAGFSLAGKRLGVVGLGNIGARVAAIGKAFGMECVAWSQNLTAEKAAAAGVLFVSKDQLFETADVITIHLVLGERTRGLVRKEDLARLKPGAVLVNTSRGPIIVEPDLLEILKAGKIHAALDVYEREPLPADHPFWTTEGIIVLPHIGGPHPQRDRFVARLFADNLGRYLDGKPLKEVVDRKAGY